MGPARTSCVSQVPTYSTTTTLKRMTSTTPAGRTLTRSVLVAVVDCSRSDGVLIGGTCNTFLKNGTEDDLGVEPLSMVAIVPFDHRQPNTTGFVECRARIPYDLEPEDLDWDIEAVAECCLDKGDPYNGDEDDWWAGDAGGRGPGGARAGGGSSPGSNNPNWRTPGPQRPPRGPAPDSSSDDPEWQPTSPPSVPAGPSPPASGSTPEWRPSSPTGLPTVPPPPAGAPLPSPSLTIISNPPAAPGGLPNLPPEGGLEPGEEEIEFDPGANGFGGAWTVPGAGGQQGQQGAGVPPGWQSSAVQPGSGAGWQASTQNAAAGGNWGGAVPSAGSPARAEGAEGGAADGQAGAVVTTPQAEPPSWLQQQQGAAGPARTKPAPGSSATAGATSGERHKLGMVLVVLLPNTSHGMRMMVS